MRTASSRRALTLIELLVIVAIIGVLAAMILGATRQVLESAKAVQCRSMLRQWGAAMMLYAVDNRHILVGTVNYDDSGHGQVWWELYPEFTDDANKRAMMKERCSKNTGGTYGLYYNTSAASGNTYDKGVIFDSYGYQSLTRLMAVYHPSDFLLMGCSSGQKFNPNKTGAYAYTSGGSTINAVSFWSSSVEQEQGFWLAHRNLGNAVLADGHVEGIDPNRALTLSNRQDRVNPAKTGIRAYKLMDGTAVVITIP